MHKTEVICSSQWQNHIFCSWKAFQFTAKTWESSEFKTWSPKTICSKYLRYIFAFPEWALQTSESPSISKRKNHYIITINIIRVKDTYRTLRLSQTLFSCFSNINSFNSAAVLWGRHWCCPLFTDASLKNILKVICREMPSFSWLSFPWVRSAQRPVRLSRPSNHCFCWRGSAPEWFKWMLKPWLTSRLLF